MTPARRVAVLASGPSLTHGDVAAIGGARQAGEIDAVIGVNGVAFHAPWIDIAFTLDSGVLARWWPKVRGPALYAAVPDEFGTAAARKKYWQQRPACAVTYLRREQGAGLSDDPGVIRHNSNSGSGALQLAWHMARPVQGRIALFGFDHDQLETYWYGRGRDCDRPWASQFAFYDTAQRQAREAGVEIVNGSPASAVPSFPKMTPGEALAWLAR